MQGKSTRPCPFCGYVVRALSRRIRHVHGQHVEKCQEATPADRAAFLATVKDGKKGRWPKKG